MYVSLIIFDGPDTHLHTSALFTTLFMSKKNIQNKLSNVPTQRIVSILFSMN